MFCQTQEQLQTFYFEFLVFFLIYFVVFSLPPLDFAVQKPYNVEFNEQPHKALQTLVH